MSLLSIPPRHGRVSRTRAVARQVTSGGAILVLLLLAACGDSSGPDGGGGGGGGATLSGTVRAAVSSEPLADATVSIGTREASSDANGQFELTEVPIGAATVRVQRNGYLPAEATVTLNAGANSRDFALTPQETYIVGANAVLVPAGVGPMRGAIIVLGGPVASGFVTGERLTTSESSPELEESLQSMGASLRALARSAHVALLGAKTTGMTNSAASDDALFAALTTALETSGQSGIADMPVLVFGLSGGAPEAAGLVSRHPERAIALIVRVPTAVAALTTPEQLAVPTFVMQAELDIVRVNTAVQATFADNRSRGGLWALSVEPGVEHEEASSRGNGAAIGWIGNALALRLSATPGEPLIPLDQVSGWLGNQATLEIAPWSDYPGDRSTASWLPSETAATSWKLLGTPKGSGGE